jgi:hypothetical protein
MSVIAQAERAMPASSRLLMSELHAGCLDSCTMAACAQSLSV